MSDTEDEAELRREYDEIMRLSAIIDSGTATSEDYIQRGLLWNNCRIYENSIADFGAALEMGNASTDLYWGLGIALSDTGVYEEAIDCFKKCLETIQDSDIYYSMALTYSRMGNMPDALANYDLALVLNPESENAYCNRGVLKMDLKDYPAALADFDKALAILPDDVMFLVNRSYVHNKLGNFAESEADFKHALKLDPEAAERYKYL